MGIEQGFKKEGSRRWFLKGTISVLGGLAGGCFIKSADYGLQAKNAIEAKRDAETELIRLAYQERNGRAKAEVTPTPAGNQKKQELREKIKTSALNFEHLNFAHNHYLESGISFGGLAVIPIMINESAEDSIKKTT